MTKRDNNEWLKLIMMSDKSDNKWVTNSDNKWTSNSDNNEWQKR